MPIYCVSKCDNLPAYRLACTFRHKRIRRTYRTNKFIYFWKVSVLVETIRELCMRTAQPSSSPTVFYSIQIYIHTYYLPTCYLQYIASSMRKHLLDSNMYYRLRTQSRTILLCGVWAAICNICYGHRLNTV